MTQMSGPQRIALGMVGGGKILSYNELLYEFKVDQDIVDYSKVVSLDSSGQVSWFYLEHRDWFRKLDAETISASHNRALLENADDLYAGMTPEERVRADAARDDSILAGKIIDADPALVHAVAMAIAEEGLIPSKAGAKSAGNPLAQAALPKGMEALSQMERAHGDDRKMTHAEKRLMKRILKNDDKAKRKREKHAEKHPEAVKPKAEEVSAEGDVEEVIVDEASAPQSFEDVEAEQATGRFAGFIEETFTRIGNNVERADGQNRAALDKKDSSKKPSSDARKSNNKSARQDMKSQMETVPGMKEAQSSGGVLGFLQLLVDLFGRGKGKG